MKIPIKPALAAIFFSGGIVGAHADVCNIVPGNITCNKGTVNNLIGNGTVTTKDTIVSSTTQINGLLNADNSHFFTLDVNGSAKLNQCIVDHYVQIKGSLTASSTIFSNTVEVYSNETRLINCKLNKDLHIGHTDSKKQLVYLDNSSEISGNIIFDDGEGEVILQKKSKFSGKVIGGHAIVE
jgi:hypothetical protein